MSRYLIYLFSSVPTDLQASFQQRRLLRLLIRIRWMFWISLLFHLVLFSFDWIRYQQQSLFANPVHLRLLYTHLASLLVIPLYWFSWRQVKAVRRGELGRAQRWITFIYVFITLYGLPRAAFAYQDRKTLLLYTMYLMVSQIVLLMEHRTRLLSTVISAGVIVPVVWASYAPDSQQRYAIPVEVLLLTLGVFSLSTYLYNQFIQEFVQNARIEAQNRTLKKQKVLLEREQDRAVQELEQRSQELVSYVLQEQQRNAFLLELRQRIGATEPERLTQSIEHQINQEDRWKYFLTLFERLHPLFFSRIQSTYPTLNAGDLRLIAMLRLNLSTKEISALLGISPQSANTARYRLRKRLDLPPEASLESFLQQH